MRWTAALAFALLFVGHARAQQRNAHWPIPPGSWLHFDGDGTYVEPWATSTFSDYQSASISSPTGALQLYNDEWGIVRNANGDILIAGSNPINGVAPGQGWLYCPWPGDSDRIVGFGIPWLIFSTANPELRSYIFKRDLGTDLWQLEPGSTPVLIDSTRFKLTAVAHANGADYWILTHLQGSDTFVAFRLSANGVDPVPVISHTGTHLPFSGWETYGLSGSLVASYDGTQLALSTRVSGYSAGLDPGYNMLSELYHFDTSTGTVVAYATLPDLPNAWYSATEFSMDGTKLYQVQQTWDGDTLASSTLRQFELGSQDSAQIAESAVIIRSDSLFLNDLWGSGPLDMATGPDGRIYLRWRYNVGLSVINEPNAPGAACNFVEDQVQLPDTRAHTLPNQCKRYHDSEFSVGVPAMRQEPVQLEVWPVPTDGLVQVRSRSAGQLLVVDALGRTVFAQPISQNTMMSVDLSGSSAGAYAVHLLAPGSAPVHRMIIKR